jgi:uncharacterized protein (DUF488 family)
VKQVLTVGHSTHPLAELVALLARHDAKALADVRRHPGSRRLPHVNREVLARELPAAGIAYEHLPELGGRRRPRCDSLNRGWNVEAFRGYADHMDSEEFAAGLERLEDLAAGRRTAVMCAEGLWWRCHRRLVADALVARGWRVLHIAPDGRLADHELPDFAVVEGRRVSYPPAQGELAPLGPQPRAGGRRSRSHRD